LKKLISILFSGNLSSKVFGNSTSKILIISLSVSPYFQTNAADYEGMLINQNAKLSLCGELNYKRVQRNCADPNLTDVKRCLELNRRDPIFKYQEEKQYSCVNSGFSHGVDIITEVLEGSEKGGGCLAKNVFHLYEEVLGNSQFQLLSQQWEESLESPLNLDVGVDTKDNIFNLQVNLGNLQIPGNKKEVVSLSVSSFSEKGPCHKLSSKEVLEKLSIELSRLSLVKSRDSIDYIGEDPANSHNPEVFDADRFKKSTGLSNEPLKEIDYSSANR
jgi:hypothetical protein